MTNIKEPILYLDDELVNLNAFRMAMGIHFKVNITQHAEEAFDILKKNEIKVVISDQRMPEITGLEFLEEVKRKHPNIICLMLTAYSDSEIMLKAINQGGIFRFIMKPWEKQDMIQTLKSAVEVYELNNENTQLVKSLKEKNLELSSFNEELLATTDALKTAENELTIQNKELEEAKLKAEESDNLKTSFLNNLSHEIRTPLNGILGFSSLLVRDGVTQDKRVEFGNIINESGNQLLEIVNDILDISKIETNQMKINIGEMNLHKELTSLFKFFEPQLKEKGLNLLLDLPTNSENHIISTDKTRIVQVFTNLIKNAWKFTSEGYVRFGYSFSGNKVQFYVEDSGIGIDKQFFEHIFERFMRVSGENIANYRGTGLGLSISKAFVNKLGGEIWLESEEGKGSKFYFTLPNNGLKVETKDDDNIADDEIIARDEKSLILVVDDEPTNWMYLREVLGDLSLNSMLAKNGKEAIDAVKQNPDINLVLMDLKMPIMDGFKATEIIKSFNKQVPIIAQTAYAMADDKVKALNVGCDDYITKPINRQELLTLFEKYLK